MKTICLSLLVALAVVSGGGCAFMSDEDRDFYGKGWVKPSDLDKPTPHRMPADPSHPEQAEAPARTASAEPEPEWLVPEQAPH